MTTSNDSSSSSASSASDKILNHLLWFIREDDTNINEGNILWLRPLRAACQDVVALLGSETPDYVVDKLERINDYFEEIGIDLDTYES